MKNENLHYAIEDLLKYYFVDAEHDGEIDWEKLNFLMQNLKREFSGGQNEK